MKPDKSFIGHGAIVLFTLMVSLAGCSIVRQPSTEEYESVRQNKKAIVLFRLTGSLDSKEVYVLRESMGSAANPVSWIFGLANLDVDEPLKTMPVRAAVPFASSYAYFQPSLEMAENGWGAFLLEPGVYYLRLTSSPKGVIAPEPEFHFVVPPDKPLVYIGSLRIACTTIEIAGWFGGRKLGYGSCSPDATAAEDEASVGDVKSILSARITRVGLRLCSPTLCLDVATHVTLFDVATQSYIYDRVLVYSGAELELQPYELFVSSPTTPATSRTLEAYCEDGGGELLKADLSNALDATMSQIVHDLGLTYD